MGSELVNSFEIMKYLLTALAVGLLIGVERGWSSRAEQEGERVAGIRTFSLIALLGGLAAIMSHEIGEWFLGVVFGAVVVLVFVGHILETKESGDKGMTTEVSILLTFILAAWAAMGFQIYSLVATVIVVTILSLKPVLHHLLSNLRVEEIYAGVKLLIISVIFLPFLPNEGFGPYEALNPYWIWWMVVLICGISFIGYFAIKYIGNRWGTMVTAITGGLASSTAVTISLAQFSREYNSEKLFMGGVMMASSIMFVRVLIEVSIVNSTLMRLVWLPITLMFLSVLGSGLWLWKSSISQNRDPEIELKNPFQLKTALQFGVLLGFILLLSEAMKEWFGDSGIYMLSIVSGLMDVDAITLSLSKMAQEGISETVAVMGIVLASAVNTLVKGFIFSFIAGFQRSLLLIGLLVLSVIPGLAVAVISLYT
jgi:uncharacterized membrane protein (DUF4010 family)